MMFIVRWLDKWLDRVGTVWQDYAGYEMFDYAWGPKPRRATHVTIFTDILVGFLWFVRYRWRIRQWKLRNEVSDEHRAALG